MTVPMPADHGGDGPAIARALHLDPATVVDLSVSLNPVAPDIVAAARGHLDALRRYPTTGDAAAMLAEAVGVDPGKVLITHGGSEAIALAAGVLGGQVASEPEFSLHPRGRSGPSWRSNPNNPTGRLAGPHEDADVWDEAFYPLATGRWTRGDRGAVVVGSLTKLFACPGLRVGYLLADDIDPYAARQPAWPVDALALAVLPTLLAAADLPGWSSATAELRRQLAELLRSHGLDPQPSDAPWLLTHAPGLRERLAPSGVIVRDCSNFGLPGVMRIAVPDERGLHRLAEALRCAAH
jgi:histidinol-phosphate/aromatic aminotransferase/cobyric acid decarboxylase-like protein